MKLVPDADLLNGNRVADVTLGDYIPIELAEQKTLNIKGNSLVILNTQKGRTFFSRICNQILQWLQDVSVKKIAVSGNYSLYKPAPEPAGAKTFQKDVMHMPLENAIRKIINSKYDILLFSSFYSEKPEHVFRTLALYALLCEIGCKVALTELPMDLHKEKSAIPLSKRANCKNGLCTLLCFAADSKS